MCSFTGGGGGGLLGFGGFCAFWFSRILIGACCTTGSDCRLEMNRPFLHLSILVEQVALVVLVYLDVF